MDTGTDVVDFEKNSQKNVEKIGIFYLKYC
jgi:hypothetical protein